MSDLAAAKAEIARYRAAVAKYGPKSDNFPKNFRPSPSIMFKTLTQADYDKAIKLVGPRGYTFDLSNAGLTVAAARAWLCRTRSPTTCGRSGTTR